MPISDKIIRVTLDLESGSLDRAIGRSIANDASLTGSIGKSYEKIDRVLAQFAEKTPKLTRAIANLISALSQLSKASSLQDAAAGMDSMQDAMSGTEAAAAGVYSAVVAAADAVSDIAYQTYKAAQETGDWGEALQNTVIDALKQIPVLGNWIAELVDSIWKTSTEKQDDYNDALDTLNKKIELIKETGGDYTGVLAQEIALINEELANSDDLGLSEEQILDLEIKRAQYENEIYEAIKAQYEKVKSIYQTASSYHLEIGSYAWGLQEANIALNKLIAERAALDKSNTNYWTDYWNLTQQIYNAELDLLDAKQQELEDNNSILEAQIKYNEALGLDTTAQVKEEIANYDDEIANLEAAIAKYNAEGIDDASLEVELWNLKTEQLELQNDLLDKQIDLMKELAGYIDVQNVIDVQTIESGLRSAGLSGTDLNSALSGMGITGVGVGDAITTSTIGTIINNYYNVSGSGSESLE